MKKITLILLLQLLFMQFAYASIPPDSYDNSLMEEAQDIIKYMESQGLGTQRAKDLAEDIRISLESKDYRAASSALNKIRELKDLSISVKAKIDDAKKVLIAAENLQVIVENEKKLLESVKGEFGTENYKNVNRIIENLVSELLPKLEKEYFEVEILLKKINESARLNGIDLHGFESLAKDLEESRSKNYQNIDILKSKLVGINKTVEIFLVSLNYVDEMSSKGFPVARISDLLNEAHIMIEAGNFERAVSIIDDMVKIKDSALDTKKNQEEATIQILLMEKEGYDVTVSKNLLSDASSSFENEDYERAKKLVENAVLESQKSKESALLFGMVNREKLKFGLLAFLKLHMVLISILAITLVLISYPAKCMIAKYYFIRKKNSLGKELIVLSSLIKKTQEDYYRQKKLSKNAYDKIMDSHQERILKIRESLPIVELKISKNGESLSRIFNPLWKFSKKLSQ